ncbi:restriction endonuclease subunit S [Polaribacter sp. 20A6]|uniref:restriction endonuclease subunit S n=1 Tax=Polaribacter sp. 20A6 TaxID=2687289 RepID=UPI0013FDB5DA|nr:restriction endonuclease subunit S [Polaribacter sp. 20A6]
MMVFKTIGQISEVIRTGKTPPSKELKYFHGDVNWYTPGDLDLTKKLGVSRRTLTELALKDKKAITHKTGTLLIGCIGDIGKIGITTNECSSNQQLTGVFPNKDTDVNYLYYWFKGNKKVLESYANNAVVPILNNKTLSTVKIPLPPLDQQKKIAAILDAADSYRQKTKAVIAKYDELTQSLFLNMFGDPVKNPKGWEKVAFGDLISVLTDYHANGSYKTLSEHVSLKNEPDFALMVRTTDLEKNNFEDDVKYIDEHAYDHLKKSKVFGGEIIINKIGSAGKVYRMPHLNRPVSLGMNAFLLRFNENVNQVFLYFQLISKYGEREIQKRVKGAVTKTIRKDAVREIPIISPPLVLQSQFAERIKAIEIQKSQAEESLVQAENLFNSLLQKAFKGELV